MSLLVWLPLNGNLNNQGASSLGAVSTSASVTVANDGKIGKCYTNSGANAGTSNDFNFSASQFSIAAWVRINTRVNSWRCAFKLANSAGDKDYIGFCCEHNTTTTLVGFHFYKTISGTNTAIFDHYPTSINAAVGTWTHLALTYNGKEVKYYQDGVCKQTSAIAAAKQNTIANTNKLIMFGSDGSRGTAAVKHSLNDVRIYDHCLSAAEVHEISQGLVLHYKLDGFQGGYGNPNLITGYDTSFLSYTDGAVTLFTNQMSSGTQEIVSNILGASKCLHLHSNGGNNRQYRTLSATSGKSYTVSVDYYSTSNQTTTLHCELNGGNYSWAASNGAAYITPNQWVHLSATYTNLTSNATLYYFIYCANGTDCYVKNFKIEEGTSATNWVPNGVTSTIIQDSSGYGHNGTILSGTATLTSNSARYSASMIFNGFQNPTIDTIDPSFISAMTNCTVTWWEYVTVTGNNLPIMGQDGSHYIGAGSTTTKLYHNNAGLTGKLYKNGIVETSSHTNNQALYSDSITYIQNQWTHFALSGANISSWTKFRLNNYSSNWPVNGYISDVRIYTTALSADDIKQLYNTAAKVDNLGSIHTFEFQEKNNPKIYKTGITEHKLLTESRLLNDVSTISFQPSANANNSCSSFVTLDIEEFANIGDPVTIHVSYLASWTNFAAGTGGTFNIRMHAQNRKKETNSWAWESSTFMSGNFTSAINANSTGSQQYDFDTTIPASYFSTYNGSKCRIRCDYSNGNGVITLSNIKITLQPNKFKIKNNYLQANNLIEK